MKIDIYTTKGKKKGTADVAETVFNAKSNESLVHQVVVSMMSNKRNAIAHTKDRSDVRGGGKKPWKQKGTGRARVGSSRSPIWRGGGVTFGPTNEKNFSKKVNSKMKAKALFAALSDKHRAGQVLFVDTLGIDAPKTASAKVVIDTLSQIKGFGSLAAKHNAAILFTTETNAAVIKSFSNFGNIDIKEVRNANPVDVLTHKNVIIIDAEAASAVLESRVQKADAAPEPKAKKTPVKAKTTATTTKKATISKSVKSDKDDLTKIEGIGPKIASVLAENGITTFAKLAKAKDEDTQEMIKDVRGNHQAGTWNEQAALAAKGKWDELKKWQDELNGGLIK